MLREGGGATADVAGDLGTLLKESGRGEERRVE